MLKKLFLSLKISVSAKTISNDISVSKLPVFQDILAVGGRYDQLIAEFSDKFSLADDVAACDAPQCAVGISISLDRLAAAVTQDEMVARFASADVLICSQVRSTTNSFNRPNKI
jgi:histidyl-tRNA synthetase